MLSISYIANIRFPTEKAHGYQIARVCNALAMEGAQVTLYVPYRRNHITKLWDAFYGLEKNFTVVAVPCIDLMVGNKFFDRIAFHIQVWTFAVMLCFYNVPRENIVMTRDRELAWLFSHRGYRTFFNAHTISAHTRLLRFFLARVAGVIANSEGTAMALRAVVDAPVSVVQNASDSNPYVDADRTALRNELGLPNDTYIAVYTGHLYSWKGADVVLGAAVALREHTDIQILCVGGTTDDVANMIAKKRRATTYQY